MTSSKSEYGPSHVLFDDVLYSRRDPREQWNIVNTIIKDSKTTFSEDEKKKAVRFSVVNEQKSNILRQEVRVDYILEMEYIDEITTGLELYRKAS